MRDLRFLLKTHYAESHALVIGLNAYAAAAPLAFAKNDAVAIRDLLIKELGFPEPHVTCLLDEQATRDAIHRAYFRFTKHDIGVDDRVLVFFAGHGHTLLGNRGEIGFLVPYDAVLDDYSTFVRWDDLTRNAELIRAKHMLFVMDACYGGLALTRNTAPGSTRFLKDMLLRHSRQVLTAGKADEVVSDAGGPLPGHSVFTGHLLQALTGNASSEAMSRSQLEPVAADPSYAARLTERGCSSRPRATASTQRSLTPSIRRKDFSASRKPAATQRSAMS